VEALSHTREQLRDTRAVLATCLVHLGSDSLSLFGGLLDGDLFSFGVVDLRSDEAEDQRASVGLLL